MHSETRGAFGTDLCHGLQFGGNDKGCFGCFLNLLNGEFGIVFGKQQTFGSYEHNAHLGDDLCDALNCGVGQFAFFKDFDRGADDYIVKLRRRANPLRRPCRAFFCRG